MVGAYRVGIGVVNRVAPTEGFPVSVVAGRARRQMLSGLALEAVAACGAFVGAGGDSL